MSKNENKILTEDEYYDQLAKQYEERLENQELEIDLEESYMK